MITLRKAEDRGRFQNGWLDSRHSFSFGQYYDPAHMGVSLLRVVVGFERRRCMQSFNHYNRTDATVLSIQGWRSFSRVGKTLQRGLTPSF